MLFPHDDSAKKTVYLAIAQMPKKQTEPIKNRETALNRFMIEFEEHLQIII